jgi:hypothetical protein
MALFRSGNAGEILGAGAIIAPKQVIFADLDTLVRIIEPIRYRRTNKA